MRQWIILSAVAVLACGLAAGCATVTKTAEENSNLQKIVFKVDMRAMADDWNTWWLVDHQTRLTRWHTR